MKFANGSLVVLAGLLSAVAAHATVGGPDPLTVLGWDAAAKRVYVHQHEWNAGGMFGTIAYFDLASAEPGTLRLLPWSRNTGEDSVRDPVLLTRLASLKRRLRPLAPEPGTVLPFRSEIVREDSLAWWTGPVPRRRVRATWDDRLLVEVDDFRDGRIVRTGVWRIPGRREHVWVLAWIGDPDEGGYEVQRAMLVLEGETGTREPQRVDAR